jgi:hypothetical protein
MENVFFTLDRVASSLGLWLNRLKSACERHDIKESYKALHFFEKQLIFASTLKLKEVVPEDKPQGRFTPSHKYCSCCGQRRGVAPLNCSTGIDEIVQIECYKQITREPGCCFEMSPQLIAHAGVYRNGGTSSDQYVCTDCLTLGLRILRDQINDVLGESGIVPSTAERKQQPQPCPGCGKLQDRKASDNCDECEAWSDRAHAEAMQREAAELGPAK